MAENIIDIVYDRIKFDKDKLESGELQRIEVDSFNLSDFWSQFGAAVQALSNEVTKIGFLCGKEPYPSTAEMSVLMQEVMQYYTVTRDLYLVLPHEVGAEVFKAVTSAMLAIMATLLDILHSLNELTEKGGKERLVLTGAFWDACNAVESLPRNNLTAVMKAVYAEAELAKDALDELTTVAEPEQRSNEMSNFCNRQDNLQSESWFKQYKQHVNINLSLNPVKLEFDLENVVKNNCEVNNNQEILPLNIWDWKIKQENYFESLSMQWNIVENETKQLLENYSVTETDYTLLRDWVCSKMASRQTCSVSQLRIEIYETRKLYNRLEHIAKTGFTSAGRRKEMAKLKKKIRDLSVVKYILDWEPAERVMSVITRQIFGENISSQVVSANEPRYLNLSIKREKEQGDINIPTSFYVNEEEEAFEGFKHTCDEDSSTLEKNIKSVVKVPSTSSLKKVLPQSVEKHLKQCSIVLSEEDYTNIKNWVETQHLNNKQASMLTLKVELDKLNNELQRLKSRSTNKFTNLCRMGKLNERIRVLSGIWQILSTDSSKFFYNADSVSPIKTEILKEIQNVATKKTQHK